MSIECPSDETLERYCAGELPGDAIEAMQQHLQACPDCGQRVRRQEETLDLLDDLRVVVERSTADPSRALFSERYTAGARFGPYEIQTLLGVGGMSKVFRAVHRETGQVVALKVLKGEHETSAEIQARFTREAHAMARIRHENILRIFECPTEAGHTGIAMDLMTGGSLAEWITRHRREDRTPDAAQVLGLSLQTARGLGAAHAKGLVHRDIKPSNLLLDGQGKLRISDFGVVQALESTTWVTGTGHQIGTPAYMSPEQCRGERANPASDIYSLGVTMFEMATGRLPFTVEGGSPLAQMLKHISEPAPDPRVYSPHLPERQALVIRKCLAKVPAERYLNGDMLCMALEKASRPVKERKAPDTPVGRKTGTRINPAQVRAQLERLPQRSIVAWACRCARRVQRYADDPRVERAIRIAESVAQAGDEAGQASPRSRILNRMQNLRTASLSAAYADDEADAAAVAAARAAAATASAASARCAADAAADAVFALENALTACREVHTSISSFWREAQRDYWRLRGAKLGAPGTIGLPVPDAVWQTEVP